MFTIPKRLRIFLRYDRSLNTILFKAAWGAISEVLGTDSATPAAVLTLQSAGDALNHHLHLHGVLADGLFRADNTFEPFKTVDQSRLTQLFAERTLAALHANELINDDDVSQILTQKHSGFSVWLGEPFVASYAEVRKEMQGRYPKHFWPADPANAQPTRRVKPHSSQRLVGRR